MDIFTIWFLGSKQVVLCLSARNNALTIRRLPDFMSGQDRKGKWDRCKYCVWWRWMVHIPEYDTDISGFAKQETGTWPICFVCRSLNLSRNPRILIRCCKARQSCNPGGKKGKHDFLILTTELGPDHAEYLCHCLVSATPGIKQHPQVWTHLYYWRQKAFLTFIIHALGEA